MKRLAFALVLLSTPLSAETWVLDGDALLGFCQRETEVDWAVCNSYIRGATEFHEFVHVGAPVYCLSDGWTTERLRISVMPWLRRNEDAIRDKPALPALMAAMADAFPCR